MRKLDLSLPGGMPFRNENLAYEQAGIADAIKGLTEAYGTTALSLGGNEITPGSGSGLFNITPGYIVVGGEVHRHDGHTDVGLAGGASAWVLQVVRDVDPGGAQVFDDLASRNPWRRTRCVLAPASPAPAEFWPLTGQRISRRLTNSAVVPVGSILPWTGSLLAFDVTGLGLPGLEMEGWAICNGNNGTVDMRGMVPMGATDVPATGAPDRYAGASDANFGDSVGASSRELVPNNIPPHTHGYTFQVIDFNGGSPVGGGGQGSRVSTPGTTQPNTTTTEQVDIRQASKVLYFVQRLA